MTTTETSLEERVAALEGRLAAAELAATRAQDRGDVENVFSRYMHYHNAFEDERIIVNLTVWESVEALGEFVFRSGHLEVLRRRREWFEKMATPYVAMWWIPAGTVPTVDEAKRRLGMLERLGPTAEAFTFKDPFPAPDAVVAVNRDDRWFCPA